MLRVSVCKFIYLTLLHLKLGLGFSKSLSFIFSCYVRPCRSVLLKGPFIFRGQLCTDLEV